ncbi:hypothetical protein N7509_000504 [Penicillium cosmopolitanum]|uniref:Uncharacterized protein n=1 Tax=Penicillium cosmopolitanum TaxID=1131564 RepID=A0A9W9WAV7_9EURO|nr:uncharacterized protein N7509_000504 [Penicillium cosmopolitanum]KAJ5413877.1 hypothetical protein N7509_000504 [Penicillium cosmopolitanum]
MLGGKAKIVGDVSEPNERAWKPDVKLVRVVIAFAMETGRSPPELGGYIRSKVIKSLKNK